jgi:hypothetical protein
MISRDLVRSLARLDQIAVLEDLGEEETLLLVEVSSVPFHIDVDHASIPSANRTAFVDPEEGLPGPVLVLGIAGGAVGVVVTFDDFGSQIVVLSTGAEPESRIGIECCLIRGHRGVVVGIRRCLVVLPLEALGPNSSRGGGVCLAATLGDFETELNVVFSVQCKAAKDDVTSSEASN